MRKQLWVNITMHCLLPSALRPQTLQISVRARLFFSRCNKRDKSTFSLCFAIAIPGPFSSGNIRTMLTMPTDQVPDNARRQCRQSFESVSSITDNHEDRNTCRDNMSHNEHSAALKTTSNDQVATGLKHHEHAEEETSSRFDTSLDKGKYSVLRRSWKTSTGVVGFYLLGTPQC
jgi:hypothetical protein